MNNSGKLQTHSAVETGVTVRSLSKDHQRAWIERIFAKLTSIYGDDFTRNWRGIDPEEIKAEWADTLGGFHAADIASALQACRSQPKAPNLPEFASLCRQNMNTRNTVTLAPLTPEERAAAAKVAETVAKAMSAKEANTKGYYVNGVLVTVFKQWAVNIVNREASGEQIPEVSKKAWRDVLNYESTVNAKDVASKIRQAA